MLLLDSENFCMADYKLNAPFFVEVNGQSLEFYDRQSAIDFVQKLYQPKEQQWRVVNHSESDRSRDAVTSSK